MAKLPRVTAKIFASNAAEGDIGQFGSALSGTKVETGDIAQIQALSAYETGWRGAVLTDRNYPTMQEMNGLQKTFSQQIAYVLQNGMPEWDTNTTYYENQFCRVNDKLYYSLIDDNLGNDPESDINSWKEFTGGGANTDLSNLSQAGQAVIDGKVDKSGDTMTGVLYGVASNADNSVLTTVSCNIQSGGWGYVKYGNGLIIQWGGIASGSTSRTINLSTAFSNGDYTVVIGERRGDVPTRNIVVSSRGTTSFNVLLGDNSTYGNWMAIGM